MIGNKLKSLLIMYPDGQSVLLEFLGGVIEAHFELLSSLWTNERLVLKATKLDALTGRYGHAQQKKEMFGAMRSSMQLHGFFTPTHGAEYLARLRNETNRYMA